MSIYVHLHIFVISYPLSQPETGSYWVNVQPGLWGKRNESPRPRPRAREGTGGFESVRV